MILIDNYDSFTYNIVQYLKELGVEPKVFKNDEITVNELKKLDFSSIIISPGPKNPNEAGISMDVIGEFYQTKKILGICLGHQCIAQYFGCKVIKAKEPMHGKVSKIYFDENELFEGLEQGFAATRYHSLIVDNESIADCIKPLAWVGDGKMAGRQEGESIDPCVEVRNREDETKKFNFSLHSSQFPVHSILMALRHRYYPTYGVQFHPEAILTEGGRKLLSNFMFL